MQFPPIIYQGPGFLITTSPFNDINKDVFGIHVQSDTHSFRFFLSAGTAEKKDAQLYIYYTTDYLQWPTVIYPFLNDHLETKTKNDLFEKSWHCTPAMATAIINVLRCNLSNGAGHLYYEAKALELLTLALDRIGATEDSASILKLSAYDIEMLEKARQILVSDFENIPTIK